MLVVAGSDSSAGAGVDADRDALENAGVAGRYVVTAWTLQDAGGVRELGAVAPREWSAQAIEIAAQGVRALRFGLLPGPAAVEAVREVCESLPADLPVVLDPLLASSSGTRFHALADLPQFLAELLPLGLIWTPNLPELGELTGIALAELLDDPSARERAGAELIVGGARAVVIKGGHGREDPICDLLLEPGRPAQRLERPRLPGAVIRGSGCRFASSLAAHLVLGANLPDAAARAGQFVAGRLKNSPQGSREVP